MTAPEERPAPRALYEQALRIDPENRPAALNLAALLLRDTTPLGDELSPDYRRAVRLLIRLTQSSWREDRLDVKSRPDGEDLPRDSYWFRCTYLWAADDLHRDSAEAALERATSLVYGVEAVLTRNEVIRRLRPRPELEGFALTVEDECLLLYAGARLRVEGEVPWGRSSWIWRARTERERRRELQRRLPDVTSGEVLGFVRRRPGDPRPPLSPRAHYNMGCLYAQMVEMVDEQYVPLLAREAAEHVLTAIEGDQPVPLTWVWRDPSLIPLRHTPQWANIEAAVTQRLERRGRPVDGASSGATG